VTTFNILPKESFQQQHLGWAVINWWQQQGSASKSFRASNL